MIFWALEVLRLKPFGARGRIHLHSSRASSLTSFFELVNYRNHDEEVAMCEPLLATGPTNSEHYRSNSCGITGQVVGLHHRMVSLQGWNDAAIISIFEYILLMVKDCGVFVALLKQD